MGQGVGVGWRDWSVDAKRALLGRLRDMATPVDFGRYEDDPVGFAREELGSGLTVEQVRILESVRDNRVTVVQSANAVGKTFVAADVALWWVRTFEQAEVYTTAAPPLENLEWLLWGEIGRRVREKAELFEGAKAGHLRLKFGPQWFVVGVAIPTSGSSAEREAKFSGKHSAHLLFIVDEGDAVPNEVYRGIEACMSGGHARLLVLFNPRDTTGPVYQMIQAGAQVIELDAFGHPNVVRGDEGIPGAVTREQTVRRVALWSRAAAEGEKVDEKDRDWFQVPMYLDGESVVLDDGTITMALVGGEWRRVMNPALSYMTLARFPGQAERQLISRAWVEAAQQRWLVWVMENGEGAPEGVRPVHGQDVAEFGQDRNASCFRYGGFVDEFDMWQGVDVLVTADRAAGLAWERRPWVSFVDGTGVGSGVPPGMRRWWEKRDEEEAERRAAEGLEPRVYEGRAVSVKVGGSPSMKVSDEGGIFGEFGMLRDQLWWALREWLRTDAGAMLPPGQDLADELCAPRYRVRRGKIVVDDKEKLRERLGRSPDKADSLCLTFAPEPVVWDGVGFA